MFHADVIVEWKTKRTNPYTVSAHPTLMAMKVVAAVVGACLAGTAAAFTHPTNKGRSTTVSLGETKVRERADKNHIQGETISFLKMLEWCCILFRRTLRLSVAS